MNLKICSLRSNLVGEAKCPLLSCQSLFSEFIGPLCSYCLEFFDKMPSGRGQILGGPIEAADGFNLRRGPSCQRRGAQEGNLKEIRTNPRSFAAKRFETSCQLPVKNSFKSRLPRAIRHAAAGPLR